ncbi:MAG: prepilin-type N-terminal cleavage/methylation domain-containing protein [Armatimonadota bacterium]|nr:prepilin-type N-terminal cleavage/methylation domain-containing protein [Armatimonadota bacterium]
MKNTDPRERFVNQGFTLIELLVVIAIIAILAAILFPVFMSARESALAAQCSSHGRQLGMAMLMYLDDNNGRFPSLAKNGDITDAEAQYLSQFTWTYDWPGGIKNWNAATVGGAFRYLYLYKYVKNQDIWICPNPNGLYALKFAYGYRNSWCFLTRQFMYEPDLSTYPDTAFCSETRMGDPVNGIGRTITEVQALDLKVWHRNKPPSRKIFAFCYALGPDVACRTETRAGSGIMEPPLYPHKDGTIYVYLDGHARHAVTGCGWAPVGYTDAHIDRPHSGAR